MKKYYHYGYSLLSRPANNLDYQATDNLKVRGDPIVLIHHMENFDVYPEESPRIAFIRIIVSDRIRYSPETAKKMREFCSKIAKKKVFVFYDPEWEKEVDIPQEYVVCENDYFMRGWLGRRKTVRNPEELCIKPANEYFVSFLGREGNYVGEYPPELLKEYRDYFDRFDGTFYIYWRLERPTIGAQIDPAESLNEKAIDAFKNN